MVCRVSTVAFMGVEAIPVDVQVMVAPGKINMSIVGLPDKAVAESRDRVQSALYACGLSMPPKKVTVNLAPADLPKEGSHYDLPIALALMSALGAIPSDALDGYVAIGELSLDGSLTQVTGALPAAMGANALDKGLICPQSSGAEAAWADPDMDILAPSSLIALVNHFKGTQVLARPEPILQSEDNGGLDLADIKGQESAKRALEIAAAGGHNLLLVGPPGSGKSMLSARLSSILPPLMPKELLEVSMISSIAGELPEGKLSHKRPFRAPHHSASMAAMVGGGFRARPGEVSLAHNGVLFLDEFPEFSPQVLDSLRQPLETGETVIARANHRVTYPSRIQLIAAMNPCRCGMAGEPGHSCKRGARCQEDYQARISGPLLDRIDIRVDVPALSVSEMIRPQLAESSATVAQRVAHARQIQRQRYNPIVADDGASSFDNPISSKDDVQQCFTNAQCSAGVIEKICALDQEGKTLIADAADKLKFSARAYHRILKVARTIADLENCEKVGTIHLAEAIGFRVQQSGMLKAA